MPVSRAALPCAGDVGRKSAFSSAKGRQIFFMHRAVKALALNIRHDVAEAEAERDGHTFIDPLDVCQIYTALAQERGVQPGYCK